jgi:hypothetical protein
MFLLFSVGFLFIFVAQISTVDKKNLLNLKYKPLYRRLPPLAVSDLQPCIEAFLF